MSTTIGLSRRNFLKGASLFAGGAIATGMTGCGKPTVANNQDGASNTIASSDSSYDLQAPTEISETIDVDIVVVGAGISGLAATVHASELGLNVLCLEKSSVAGGNGSGTEGIFAINSRFQKSLGIEITPADIISTELEESQWRGDGSLWLNMCRNSADNIDWLIDNGVRFSGVVDNYHTGAFDTMHWFEEVDGAMGRTCYVEPMVAKAEANGATIRYDAKAYKLIQNDDGSIAGLYAEDLASESFIQVNAKAVILASGGIGGNPELLKKQGWQQQNIDDKIVMCVPSVEGDGYKMAIEIGAKDYLPLSCDQAFIGIKAIGTDATPPYSSMLNGANGIAGAGMALWLNQDGFRFTNEAIGHVNLAAPEPACCRTNRASYAIFDQSLVDTIITDPADLEVLNSAVKDNANADSIVSGDSIEELAANFGLATDVVLAEIERYNSYCETGKDLDFAKDAQFLTPLATPPYYMAKLVPLFVVVIGGIYTNIRSEVLDEELNAIPGLYAVGLEGAMLHRNVYTQNMPGSNMGNNVNTGRTAAANAAAYIAS